MFILIFIDTFILQNCDVTLPSIGTIRVSCDSPHQIIVTLTCTNNCTNPMMTSNGNSPLTVRGLDPGIMYSVTINVFNGNQVVFRNETVMKTIIVMGDQSGKIIFICMYRIAQNIGGRKLWRIWQLIANPPKFYPPMISFTMILHKL